MHTLVYFCTIHVDRTYVDVGDALCVVLQSWKDHCRKSKDRQTWEMISKKDNWPSTRTRICTHEKGSARMREAQEGSLYQQGSPNMRNDQQWWGRLRRDHCISKDHQTWEMISNYEGGSGGIIVSARITKHEKWSAMMREAQVGSLAITKDHCSSARTKQAWKIIRKDEEGSVKIITVSKDHEAWERISRDEGCSGMIISISKDNETWEIRKNQQGWERKDHWLIERISRHEEL